MAESIQQLCHSSRNPKEINLSMQRSRLGGNDNGGWEALAHFSFDSVILTTFGYKHEDSSIICDFLMVIIPISGMDVHGSIGFLIIIIRNLLWLWEIILLCETCPLAMYSRAWRDTGFRYLFPRSKANEGTEHWCFHPQNSLLAFIKMGSDLAASGTEPLYRKTGPSLDQIRYQEDCFACQQPCQIPS